MLNIILSFIIGALVLIIALPLLFLNTLRGRIRNMRVRKEKNEGEVTVSGQDATAGEKIIGDHVGEYVDYEEVEERKKK